MIEKGKIERLLPASWSVESVTEDCVEIQIETAVFVRVDLLGREDVDLERIVSYTQIAFRDEIARMQAKLGELDRTYLGMLDAKKAEPETPVESPAEAEDPEAPDTI